MGVSVNAHKHFTFVERKSEEHKNKCVCVCVLVNAQQFSYVGMNKKKNSELTLIMQPYDNAE